MCMEGGGEELLLNSSTTSSMMHPYWDPKPFDRARSSGSYRRVFTRVRDNLASEDKMCKRVGAMVENVLLGLNQLEFFD